MKKYKKLKDSSLVLKKVFGFLRKNVSIFISLIALSVTLNNARISASNNNLDSLYKNCTTYISNLNKLDLIYSYRAERTTSVKKEEIEINVTNRTIYELIIHSINKDNKYSKKLIVTLNNIKEYHELEIERLNKSFYLSNLRAQNETDDLIFQAEKEYREIENKQKKVQLDEGEFSTVLDKYYTEEKKLNSFKLFYLF